jgi:signal transduction histidine kinase
MNAASAAAGPPSALPGWLQLERLGPFDAYAQAVGTVMLVLALLQWLCSFHADRRALRIYALLYLLTGLGWLFGHPRAHGGAGDVPLLPVTVAVVLLGLNVWALYEFLGLTRQRAWALVGGTVAAGAALFAWLLFVAREPDVVYAAMAAAFAYCAWLAVQAARAEGNVGHLYVAAAYATYPLLFALFVALPDAMAGFEIGYYASVPGLVVGMTVFAVSLIRARKRLGDELVRRNAAEDELRLLNATLEERVAARTRELNDLVAGLESFNRSVSHDLRDPLAGLSGLARLGSAALERDDPARARSYLDTIHAQTAQLGAMVQELLLLSRAADAPPRRERVALRRCVDEAIDQLRVAPATGELLRHARLEVQPLPGADVDPALMRQAFVNLIGNALKFGGARQAEPRVAVGLRDESDGPALYVEDDGLGLPAGREHELFKPFARLHGDLVPGRGVGLTIVRRIVEAHGGRIWAERSAAGGARFVFTLDGLGR